MSLDITKDYVLRDGHSNFILIDRVENYNQKTYPRIVGLIYDHPDKGTRVAFWDDDGTCTSMNDSNMDLILKDTYFTGWYNAYHNGKGAIVMQGPYVSLLDAKESTNEDLELVCRKHIDVVKGENL